MQRVFGLMRSAILLVARVMMLVTAAIPAGSARATELPGQDDGTGRGPSSGTFIPIARVPSPAPATLARRFTVAQFAGQSLDELVNTPTPDEEPAPLALLSVATTDDEVTALHVREACRPSGSGVAMKNHLGWTILVSQGSFTACYNSRTITGISRGAYPSVELTAFAKGQIRVR